MVGSGPLPAVEPFGLLDGLPAKVREDAREWERHLVEVETGLPPDPPEGAPPRPEYDPATTTVPRAGTGEGGRAECGAADHPDPQVPLCPAGLAGPTSAKLGAAGAEVPAVDLIDP